MESRKIDYLAAPLGRYLERLASAEPVPGGGSAGALSAALSAALLSMPARFTIGRKKYAAVEAEISALLEKSEECRARAGRLVEEDSRVYLEYRSASALERDDPARPEALKRALERGNELLLEIVGLSREIISLAGPLLEKGNPWLASDVACAVYLARAAAGCASASILINLSGLGEPAAGETREKLDRSMSEIERDASALLEKYAVGK